MTTHLLDFAIDLNQHATEMLEVGQLDEGIHGIKVALALLHSKYPYGRQEVPVGNPNRSDPAEQEQLPGQLGFRKVSLNHQTVVHSVSYHSVPIGSGVIRRSGLVSDNLFTLYPKVFCIHKAHAHQFGVSNVVLVLLFNLAAAIHIKTFEILERHPEVDLRPLLSTVIQLYENVTMASWGSLSRTNDFQEMLCLLIATANNIGHCNHALYEFPKFRESIALTLDLLSLSSDYQYPIPANDMEIFLSSTLIFLESPGRYLCNAPAA